MNKYIQQAYHIIEKAEALAERKYRQAVTKTLPRQLAKTPKDEHRDEIRRQLQQLKDGQQTGCAKLLTEDGQLFKYSPYLVFAVEKRSRDELAAALGGWLWDAADGLTNPLSNEPAAILALADEMFTARYILHLVELLDRPAQAQGKGTPAAPAEPFGEDLAQMIREALEARGQLKDGKFTGNSTQVKALYNVLAAGGHLKWAYPHTRFAAFFLEYFGFQITGRTLQNPPNRGQDREEREYRQLLP